MKPVKMMTPKHLFYLIQIFMGRFDQDLRNGRFAGDSELRGTLVELHSTGFTIFFVRHELTEKGVEKIRSFLAGEDEGSLEHLSMLLEVYMGVFQTRLQRGVYANDTRFDETLLKLLEKKMVGYDGVIGVTPAGTERISDHVGEDLGTKARSPAPAK